MNVKPKKHLGQHFLTDLRIAERIAGLCLAAPCTAILEIGPGKGVLSQYFRAHPRVHLVDIDAESIAYLQHHFQEPGIRIHEADILKTDPTSLVSGPFTCCGNLPYNISSPIFFWVLDNAGLIEKAVFMIQKEVAERIAAPPGSRTYGILSVLTRYYFDVEYAFTVKPGAFFPPPKVNSGVLTLSPHHRTYDVPFVRLREVVKTAFGQRRKTLRNALSVFQPDSHPDARPFLDRRAETLSLDEFLMLTRALS